MKPRRIVTFLAAGACIASWSIDRHLTAQSGDTVPLGTSAGLNGLLASTLFFTAADANKDGVARVASSPRRPVTGLSRPKPPRLV